MDAADKLNALVVFARRVAGQCKSDELDAPEDGDFEGGFDTLVDEARELIASLEK